MSIIQTPAPRREESRDTCLVLCSSLDILLDTLPIEYMSTLGLDSVLCDVMADPTNARFGFFVVFVICLVLEDQVGLWEVCQ